jgi:dTDP-4-amino-4,6-dideoxygalactose transaminase
VPGPGISFLGDEEERAVLDVLRSRQLSRYRFDAVDCDETSKVQDFERAFGAVVQTRHVLGLNSCTSALFAGLLAAGLEPGDEVIVPGYTFVASLAAIAYAGGIPVLAEIDDTLTVDPVDVAAKITDRTRAIMAVHMLGAPCDLAALEALSVEHGLFLVEDCAQACGATFQGRAVGSVGRFGAFSLNVFKTMTAGDGGILTTDDDGVYDRAFAIHDHGWRPLRSAVSEGTGPLGLNLRMHELTGAVALVQTRKLPVILDSARRRKQKLREAIGHLSGVSLRSENDAAGDCGSVLAFTFERAEHAARTATALGTQTLIKSGNHVYSNMLALRTGSVPLATPLGAVVAADDPYRPGRLPRTDDLLARSVALSVGVVDSYLGTGFGIHVSADDAQIERAAAIFRAAVTAP